MNGSWIGDYYADAEIKDECRQKLGPRRKHRERCRAAQEVQSWWKM
jgi:hypothetical protein